MNPWVTQLQKALEQHANKENAYWMANYMRNQFEFLGVKKPIQMQVFRQEFSSYDKSLPYLQVATELRKLKPHEFHYLSMVLVIKLKSQWDEQLPIWVEEMTLLYPWWDITDVLAPKILGPYFLKFPKQKEYFINRWLKSEHIWLQRLCILYQLDYKSQMDTQELTRIINQLSYSKEFFIQKAIGWILRQYARTNPAWVRAFVQHHSLSALSKREALKHLK